MSLDPETAATLAKTTAELVELHEDRARWNAPIVVPRTATDSVFSTGAGGGAGGMVSYVSPATADYPRGLSLSQEEGNLIFDRRIAAVEARIADLGFRRVERVPGGAM